MRPILVLTAIALLICQALLPQHLEAQPVLDEQQSVTLDSLTVNSVSQSMEPESPLTHNGPLDTDFETQTFSAADSPRVSSIAAAGESDTVRSRSLVFLSDPASGPFAALDSTQRDTLPPPIRPRLLPENISFMERGLWGEEGILRKVGIASPLTPDVRKSELALRRTMLTIHQIGGFVTLGLMGTTVYFGQKYLNNGQRSDRNLHQQFVTATIASYTLTGLLSVLSPPPLIRRNETSTTTIHKTLAWVHFAGMVLTPILGKAINRHGSSYYDRAHVHQVSAYITTAVFAASMIVITF